MLTEKQNEQLTRADPEHLWESCFAAIGILWRRSSDEGAEHVPSKNPRGKSGAL